MSEPVIVAVPPKGGSLDDVLRRLARVGWLRHDLVEAVRRLVRDDKRRIKLEEGLIVLWREHGGDQTATLRAADAAGHDLEEVEVALARMRRIADDQGRTQLTFTPKAGVDALLQGLRHDEDAQVREAAMTMHLELDLTRFGRPSRMMFDHFEFEWTPPGSARALRGVLVGTEHEVTPTYLRKHKRDLSLTCYDAFHNTLLDALDTGKVRNWRELMEHLIEANTDVRILGSFGLGDYLGHFVLMPEAMARRVRALDSDRRWGNGNDRKLDVLAEAPVLIDAQYEAVYMRLLDAPARGIAFESTSQSIEDLCVNDGRAAIYVVRSGSTVACTPGLCVVGDELVTSETIVAVNQERLDHNQDIGVLAESLQPSAEDRSDLWRARLAEKLGAKLI